MYMSAKAKRFIVGVVVVIIIIMILASCSQYTCPTYS